MLTWNSVDLFDSSLKENLGIIGMSGLRGANKAIFNSDLIVCLGNHLPIPQTTTLYKNYASQAKKIIINIDPNQLKNLNVKFDIKINLDCNFFFKKIKNKIKKNIMIGIVNIKNITGMSLKKINMLTQIFL